MDNTNESGSASENSSGTITKEQAILIWIAFCESKNVEAVYTNNFTAERTLDDGKIAPPFNTHDYTLILYSGRKKIMSLTLIGYPNEEYLYTQLYTPWCVIDFDIKEYTRLEKIFRWRSRTCAFNDSYDEIMKMALDV